MLVNGDGLTAYSVLGYTDGSFGSVEYCMMLGDIGTCLFVAFRVFLVLILIINVIAWLLLGDDEQEEQDAARPPAPTETDTDSTPSDAVPCSCALCVFARSPLCAHFQVAENESSPAGTGSVGPEMEALMAQVVRQLAASINEERRAAADTCVMDSASNTHPEIDVDTSTGERSTMAADWREDNAAQVITQLLICQKLLTKSIMLVATEVAAAKHQQDSAVDSEEVTSTLNADEMIDSETAETSQQTTHEVSDTEPTQTTSVQHIARARRPASHS